MRPIIGYNYGAKEFRCVRRIFYTAMAIVCGIMAVGTVLSFAFSEQLIAIFTENADTVTKGGEALRILCIGFIVSSVSVTATGSLEGLGKELPSLMISLCRYVLVIIPAALVLSCIAGVVGVWHAFWLTELATAVFSYVYLLRIFKRMEQ